MSAHTEQSHFPKGSRLGPYEIASSIGAGGMGEVFRARDTRLNRDVAIKVLPKDFVSDAERLRRFEQEAKTLAAPNHPVCSVNADMNTPGWEDQGRVVTFNSPDRAFGVSGWKNSSRMIGTLLKNTESPPPSQWRYGHRVFQHLCVTASAPGLIIRLVG